MDDRALAPDGWDDLDAATLALLQDAALDLLSGPLALVTPGAGLSLFDLQLQMPYALFGGLW